MFNITMTCSLSAFERGGRWRQALCWRSCDYLAEQLRKEEL